jgi:hypothetical protein
VNIGELLESAAGAAGEIAAGPLSMRATIWEGLSRAPLPEALCGVYIPLIGDGLALQFGVLAERNVCVQLAKALLGMSEEEPLDSDEDVFDAVGEIANLIAGGVKVRLAGQLNVNLGIPLALRGKVFSSVGSQTAQGLLRMDEHATWLVLTGTKRR